VTGFVCGIDIGGTFTDCVLAAADGTAMVAKADTTREAPAGAVVTALRTCAAQLDTDLRGLLARTTRVVVGSTLGTNAVVAGERAPVGLLTSRGFADTLFIMRGGLGLTAGRPAEDVLRPQLLRKPEPVVARRNVLPVDERTGPGGEELVRLDAAAVRRAVAELAGRGCQAVAICFLWSCANPAHELAAEQICRQAAPALHVSVSHRVSGRLGEYERFAATVFNAALQTTAGALLGEVATELRRYGLDAPVLFSTGLGSAVSADVAADRPLDLLGAGPACGNAASRIIGRATGEADIVLCDMGGTTFDVSLVEAGEPVLAHEHVISGYTMYLPRIEVTSIGAGGGSIARTEDSGGRPLLRVGPASAGAVPGPACFGRGGTAATVTDADVVLGYLPSDRAAPGSSGLSWSAARDAVAACGEPFGWTPEETALAITAVVDGQSADLIREMTIARGIDPRAVALYAYGGAGPVHIGAIARVVGVARVSIPPARLSASWSAFGAARAETRVVLTEPVGVRAPWRAAALRPAMTGLAVRAAELAGRCSGAGETADVSLSARIAYGLQPDGAMLPLPRAIAAEFTDEDGEKLQLAFFDWHEQRYGQGLAYRSAAIYLREITAIVTVYPAAPLAWQSGPTAAARQEPGQREVYWPHLRSAAPTLVYSGEALPAGQPVTGPALIDLPGSTLVVHQGQRAVREPSGLLTLHVQLDAR
jgi:N-methylhydantoinase A